MRSIAVWTSVVSPKGTYCRGCKNKTTELIAISGDLDYALNSYKDSIWILTDSRSSIQYVKNWPKIMDSTGLDILSKLARLGQRKQVCLQWIPSHVVVPGNKAAMSWLVGVVISLTPVLTHSEIPSLQRTKLNFTRRNPPAHHWYASKSPGLSMQCRSSRAHQTALARLRSGRLRSMTLVQGVKSFFKVLSLLLLLLFWTAGAFPCNSCMKSKSWTSGDVSRHFELRSSDEDNTRAGFQSPNSPNMPMRKLRASTN
ncbi:RNase H domain-containing protein [Trichonephila clavipes]|nr:RNase H domain-containing protein [Trichonephila clavipes]